jgi:hypothetical protein
VQRIARTSALAKETWARARRTSDFPLFAPLLGQMI